MRLHHLVSLLLILCFAQMSAAQSAGFSVSAGANYSLMQAPNALVKIPFSEFVNNKFKTYDVLSESAFEFSSKPGGFLSGGVQWNLSRSVLIGTGIILQYSAYDLRPGFEGYRPVPRGSDTIFLPLVINNPVCDDIIFPDNFSPDTDPNYRHELVHLQIPLELRLRPGKGQLEVAAGLWTAVPAWTRISKEQVRVDRQYMTSPSGVTTSTCTYSKGISRETTADGLNNLMWGARGELSYRFTPVIGIFAGYSLSLANIYDRDSKPALPGSSIAGINARQQVIQLGLRYQWEPERPEAADDGLGKLNQATHKQFFQKKNKNAYKKHTYQKRPKKRR